MTDGVISVLRGNLARALGAGELAEAALVLERLKEEDPLSVETRGLELDYLLHSRRLREARVLADQLVRLFPGSPRIHYLAGQMAYQTKDYATAAERFRESYRLRSHWRSQLALARTLTQMGHLDQAVSIFERLLPDHPECSRDLAWLYERQENLPRAIAAIETYLRSFPDNTAAQSHRLRLRARAMDPAELVRETQELLEYGETLPDYLVPIYLSALFATGRAREAREFLQRNRAMFPPPVAVGAGWSCYRFQCYDLAFELFAAGFGGHGGNAKFLSAIEFAASRSSRLAELIRIYEQSTADHPTLHGRLRNLRRRAASNP